MKKSGMTKSNKDGSNLKYFCEGLTPELVQIAREELGETEEVKCQGLKEIKELIHEEPHFYPCMEDSFLLRYLRAAKYDVAKAYRTLKNYYTFKGRYAGVLTDFKPSDILPFLESKAAFALEYRDKDYVGIGLVRIGHLDIDQISSEDILASVLVVSEVGCTPEATQVVGYSMIFDFDNFNLRMSKHYASPSFLYKLVNIIQDCIPCRVKAFHFINEPFYINILFNIARSFMSEKMNGRLHFHGSNLKHLHKYISPEVLPEEYGGKRGSVSQHAKVYAATILSHEEHVIRMNQFGFKDKALEQLKRIDSKELIIS